MTRAQDQDGYRFSLLVADVNDLKRINDQRGHAAGDQALRWVARFLAGALRADDVCCRIGGDEFLLILPGDGRRRVPRLRQAPARRLAATKPRAHDHAVAVSLGTASYPTDGGTVEALCAVADGAMYEEKRRGVAPEARAGAQTGSKAPASAGAAEPGAAGPRQTSRSTA